MEIISIDKVHSMGRALGEGQGIALTQNFEELDNLTRDGVVLDGFCIVYLEAGQASFCLDGETLRIGAGEMLFISGGHPATDIMMSAGMKFKAVFMSYEMMDELSNKLRLSWSLRAKARDFGHFCQPLSADEGRNFCHYYDLLDSKRTATRHQQQIITTLCEAFGYDLLDMMEHHGLFEQVQGGPTHSNTSGDHHFDRFMHLVMETHPIQRQVSWYADQLNITAKYLSMICQKVAHESPSTIIERELTQQALQLLKDSSLSVKEISQELGFNNQSHFGTYLKRVTGKGPGEMR